MNAQKISERLVSLRKSKGLTQIELAQKINYSDKVISKWERGESLPSIEAFKILADFYNVKVDDLIEEQYTLDDNHENYRLVTTQTQGPSSFFKISIIIPLLFFIFGVIYTGYSEGYNIFLLALSIFVIYSIIWSIVIVYVTYETTYNGHTIKFINKPLSAGLYIDDKLVDSCNSLFTLGYKLTGKINNKTIKANISANVWIKCSIFVE